MSPLSFGLGKNLSSGGGIVTNRLVLSLDAGRTNSYNPNNLLNFTEKFDNAAWFKNNYIVTANATTAPDGTLTADKLIAINPSTFHDIYRSPGLSSGTYTLSIFAKEAEQSFIQVRIDDGVISRNARFNLATGSVSSSSNVTSPTITPYPDGWYRCSITVTTNIVNAVFNAFPTSSGSTYSGDGVSGIFIWGAQLEVGSVATDYVPEGTWTDLSGNGNTGTLVNGVGYSASNGGALVFDGVNDYVSGTITPLTGNYTIEIIFKLITSNAGDNSLIALTGSNAHGFLGEVSNSDKKIRFLHRFPYGSGGGDSFYSSASINLNQIYSISWVRDSNQKIYINGIFDSQITSTNTAFDSSLTQLTIGQLAQTSSARIINGNIYSCKLYNRALTAAEIQQNFNALCGRFRIDPIVTTGLVLNLDAANTASYPGTGTTWTDLSGNGNTGTLTNGPTYNSANGGSIVFDGIDDYSTLTSNYTLSAGWTLSFWGNPIFDSTVIIDTVFYSASTPRTFSLFNSSTFPIIIGIDFDASNNLYVTSPYTDGNGNLSTLKFNSSYQLDTNFNCGDIGFYSPRPWQTKVSTYYPGKLYVTYGEYSTGKFNQRGLRRLNSNGSLDTSFNSGGVGFNLQVHDVEEDSNGKLYVAGQFTSYNGTAINRIVRLNTDGSIDTSFNVGTGFNALVYNLEWDSTNNKLYAFGGFTSYNGTAANYIIRLNSDGSIDNTFNSGTGFNNTTYIGKLDSNGKLYVGGFFTSYNGTGANRIIRLNSDGSIDTNFVYGTGINSTFVTHIEINSSGKIFVCGSNFSTYNGTTANDIVKLNSDGSIDTSFSTGTGFISQVRVLKQDSTGKLVVGGPFTSYNGTTVSGLILLNSDGTLNTDIMSGFSGAGRLENYYTDSNTSSILDLYEAGVTPQRIITSTELYSIFNGNTSINVVESMSSSGTYRYYMNGVLLVEVENVPTTSVNIQGLMRGAFGGWWYKGKMSNISIYNRELSTNEVSKNFNALRYRYGI